MARNSGQTTRDLGLRGKGAGKGSAPRNLGKAFRDNFPDGLTGQVDGFKPTGYLGVTRKVYGSQQVTQLGKAPHVGQHFQIYG